MTIEVGLTFILNEGVNIDPDEFVVINLPCPTCHRGRRAVSFNWERAFCTPTNHDFSGKIIDTKTTNGSIGYIVEFEYYNFIDEKFLVLIKNPFKVDNPVSWVRFYFSAKCPVCAKKTKIETQTNQTKPVIEKCSCGSQLIKITKDPFSKILLTTSSESSD